MNNLTEKNFTTFETEQNFCFHNICFGGLRHCFLAEVGIVFFIFALYLLLIFVVICQILCN